ncbi:MAG: FMN-binding negative transcriptional regulator [Pseudomonadota bacterium]|nr:FMN-binding negative transcriptional regulator [Pseudomonadota bacterium]
MSLYVPTHFAPSERSGVVRLMHDHPFATLITPQQGEVVASHLPLIHIADCEPHGTLLGHFARANLHVDCIELHESVAVFHGPHAYVSPSLYTDPDGSVPTWNYAVVHAHGTARLATDPVETRSILDALIHRFEMPRPKPWTLALDAARLDAMVGAIVGFRLRIKRIEGKFKLSQNRSREDRLRVAEGLAAAGDPEAAATAAWMRSYSDVDGKG